MISGAGAAEVGGVLRAWSASSRLEPSEVAIPRASRARHCSGAPTGPG